MGRVPSGRVRAVNDAPVRAGRDFVLYWMIASRRAGYNFALQRAVEHAEALGRPLVVLEALRVGYRWASDRLHRFVLDGMADNRHRFASRRALYHAYVEPSEGAGRGLLEALAARACVAVTDDYPAFFVPRMIEAAGLELGVRLEAVDSNGLLPMRAAERGFERAQDFRRALQRLLPAHLSEAPAADPLEHVDLPVLDRLPHDIERRWPAAGDAMLEGGAAALAGLPIDHGVPPAPMTGGTRAAVARWRAFRSDGLGRYAAEHDHPDADASSGLSPWLHFGHLSVHQVFEELADARGWSAEKLAGRATGRKTGWWNMDEDAEAFLDELVTWRELGFHFCLHHADYDQWSSLPAWARETLDLHRSDERPHLYEPDQLERAATDDEVWNAAQRQLVREGRIHNYLRMLWGKRMLEWRADPRDALRLLEHLNNKYAVDGRDPNSYSGIFWVFGRHDRPWPERPIFGKVRCMTSASAKKKLRMSRYLERWSG